MTSPVAGHLDGNGLEILTREECLTRLARGGVGRLGLVDTDKTLAILPVNFALYGSEIVMRTGSGGAIHRVARAGAAVAFETDETDPGYHGGRSVLVRGQARVVAEEDEPAVTRVSECLPWGRAEADVLVAVSTDVVTGRRIPARSVAALLGGRPPRGPA
jgi:nitroimidazol reductase NimA-like FMN-containing flavoprotein (pyridoxamine 5'-phosphate oxidase superfamily)